MTRRQKETEPAASSWPRWMGSLAQRWRVPGDAMSLIDALDFIWAGLTGYTVRLPVPGERLGYPALSS